MTTATIDTPVSHDPCARCGGHLRLYSTASHRHDGPTCPRCNGRGVEPTQLGPRRDLIAITASIASGVVSDLEHLRLRRETWQHSRKPEGTAKRAEITADIKATYWKARDLGLRIGDIADLLGISRQRLDKIIRQP